jgi:alpha-mannosidase
MITHPKTIEKLVRVEHRYEKEIFKTLGEVEVQYFETQEHLRQVPGADHPWRPVTPALIWGEVWGNAWFKGRLEIQSTWAAKDLYIQAEMGAWETLFFVDGQARGIFSRELETGARGYHHTLLCHKKGSKTENIELAFECYAGHPCVGTMPIDDREGPSADPNSYRKNFKGIFVLERRDDVKDFVFDLKALNQLVKCLPESSFRRGQIVQTLTKVLQIVPQFPDEVPEIQWKKALLEARKVMAAPLQCTNGSSVAFAGLTGHSHMDTAWLWTSKETIRKCARTFSNALNLMEQYTEYRFMQSSPIHAEMIREHYPEIFERIKAKVKEGRWEPNGGMYVESDGNMPSGESFIRQFVYGQKFTQEHFNYRADTFWLPDTFGYSAALPQILKGCGIKYFLTTKLAWNETNTFPMDTFKWCGIDGTSVLVHFNETHCWPDPATLIQRIDGDVHAAPGVRVNKIQHTDVNNKRLISYGFGDGGGGPMYEMLEMARRAQDLEGCPLSKHMGVSEFMGLLEAEQGHFPVYHGELYFEGHRGVLTSQHLIKKLNRQLEMALRDLDCLNTLVFLNGGAPLSAAEMELHWKVLLKNQFHDILPGTSIPEEHTEAKLRMSETLSAVNNNIQMHLKKLGAHDRKDNDLPVSGLTIFNSLSWDNHDDLDLPALPEGQTLGCPSHTTQIYTNIQGELRSVVEGCERPPLATSFYELCSSRDHHGDSKDSSPFTFKGNTLKTPFYTVLATTFPS